MSAVIDDCVIMTDEIGAMTGPLMFRKTHGPKHSLVVAYEDTHEWFTVSGGKIPGNIDMPTLLGHIKNLAGTRDGSGNMIPLTVPMIIENTVDLDDKDDMDDFYLHQIDAEQCHRRFRSLEIEDDVLTNDNSYNSFHGWGGDN